ncbi:MAG: diguanylate cyclase [Nitrospirae bacterium]|nr:diguanylate cyclase [Nitrospirota bacterium]
MSIKSRIIYLIAIPLIAMSLFIIVYEMVNSYEKTTYLQSAKERIIEIRLISNIIHNLQRERGLSIGYLSGAENLDSLRTQIDNCRKCIKDFENISKNNPMLRKLSENGKQEITSLRTAVIQKTLVPHDAEARYNNIISLLIGNISTAALMENSLEAKNDLMSLSHLMYAKEYLGRMRAHLYAVFTAGKFNSYTLEKLAASKGAYDVNVIEFQTDASSDILEFYKEKTNEIDFIKTKDMIRQTFLKYKEDDFGIDPDVWLQTSTVSMNLLKEVEDRIIANIESKTLERLNVEHNKIVNRSVVILIVIMLIVLLASVTISKIMQDSGKLYDVIKRIKDTGDLSVRIDNPSSDEIGLVSNIFNEMLTIVGDLMKEKERLAETDKLTGAYNRMKFDALIVRELSRAGRYKTHLSLIMFDLDHFKRINDTFGHQAGDMVLINTARIVMETIRDVDILTRWGGEEFLVITPGVDRDGAYEMAERLRKMIEGFKFEDIGRVTASFGVTQSTEKDTPKDFCKRTDEALYMAKDQGRNRVIVI